MSVKENKKLLKVQPIKSEFGTKEPVALQGELYNQGLEFVKGHEINVLLKDEQKKVYRYTMSDQDVKYSLTLNNLSPGSYNYVASAAIGSQKLSDNGSFVDFDLLKRLAIKTDGRFYEPTIIDSLEYNLLSNKVGKTQILDQHKYTDFIRFRVLFWVIFLILSIEWFVRKWAGGY